MRTGIRRLGGSLRFRLLALVAGVGVAIMAAQLVIDAGRDYRATRQKRLDDAQTLTGVIARSLEGQFGQLSRTEIEEILQAVRARSGVVELSVVDRDLKTYLDGIEPAGSARNFRYSELQLRSMESGTTEIARTGDGIEVAEPLSKDGKAVGSVLVRFHNPGIVETLREILAGKLTAMLPILITGLLFALGLANQIVAPLHRLSVAARSLADGDLDQKIEIAGNGEIRQLAEAFSAMIGRLKSNIEQIYELAYVDRITRLPNREYFRTELTRSIHRAKRRGVSGALLFVDLDGFKRVNDTLGHDLGDKLLAGFADRVSAVLRADDTVCFLPAVSPEEGGDVEGAPGALSKERQVLARLGGDEFTILLSEIREETDAATVARRIVAATEEPFDLGGTEVRIGASVGIATFPRDGEDYATVLKCADMAMYQAKKEGKSTYHYFSEELNERVSERMLIEGDLRRALENGEMALHFQPKVDCATGIARDAEALLRWSHPRRGSVPPATFIPVAEESGLIIPLGDWVLETACQQIRAFEKAGHPLTVAVNISIQQFDLPDFASRVLATVVKTGINPARLELEVTESMAMSDPERARHHMESLKAAGIRFAIDDFGTGYSNLSQLSRLPFDVFKIDRSFVDGLDNPANRQGHLIVRSILALARSLDYETVAEGVETPQQLEFLVGEGCTHAQGYLFCKPMPAADLVEWLARNNANPQFRAERKNARAKVA
jgi:predicted signal transduction protein with EAL and GGDEF domain